MSDQYFTPVTGTATGTSWELSGWWKRVGALIIDQIVIVLPIFVLGILAALTAEDSSPAREVQATDFVVVFGFLGGIFIFPAVYYCWIMSRTNGQTFGKQAMGIRVVREDGQAVTAGFAFRRQIIIISWGFSFLGGILLFGIPIIVDYLWPLWDKKNQALHDKLVKSRVVLARQVIATGQAPSTPHAAPVFPVGPAAPRPYVPPVPAVPPEQRYVAPMPPVTPPSTPYVPPTEFENPVPDDEK